MKNKKHLRLPPTDMIAVSVIGLLLAGHLFVYAQSFQAPTRPAPDNSEVNQLSELSSFLLKAAETQQELDGPLHVGLQQNASALLSMTEYASSVIGAAGTTTPATLSDLSVLSSASYGYASGTSSTLNSVGVYASADGSGAGLTARTLEDTGTAGRFWGDLFMSGSLYVEDAATIGGLVVSASDAAEPAIDATGGITLSGTFQTGLVTETDDFYSLYGQSAGANGIWVRNSVSSSVTGPRVTGISAAASDGSSGPAAYGWSTGGNGVEGQNDSNDSVRAAVEGESTSIGAYGRGGAFAGYFEGDVEVSGSVFFDDFELTETILQYLITWCGSSYCPDPSF